MLGDCKLKNSISIKGISSIRNRVFDIHFFKAQKLKGCKMRRQHTNYDVLLHIFITSHVIIATYHLLFSLVVLIIYA
ncbi:hypothetical protein DEH83_07525 [Streptococcus constellatus]|nr:hypothetical protein DEH83_07525 [Streptococcus constellatus]